MLNLLLSTRIHNQIVPQWTRIKYLDIHIDRCQTWKSHIKVNSAQIKWKLFEFCRSIGTILQLKLDCKLLLYNTLLYLLYDVTLFNCEERNVADTKTEKLSNIQLNIWKSFNSIRMPWIVTFYTTVIILLYKRITPQLLSPSRLHNVIRHKCNAENGIYS